MEFLLFVVVIVSLAMIGEETASWLARRGKRKQKKRK
jgi:hypothetical protein